MSLPLEEELEALRRGQHPELERIEAGVWRRIASLRERRATASLFLPVQAAAVVAALGLGVAGGAYSAAAAAAEPEEVSVFSTSVPLAPSSLLDGHG